MRKVAIVADVSSMYYSLPSEFRNVDYEAIYNFAYRAYGQVLLADAFMAVDDDSIEASRGFVDKVNLVGYNVHQYNIAGGEDKERAYEQQLTDCISNCKLVEHIVVVTNNGQYIKPMVEARRRGIRVELLHGDGATPELLSAADLSLHVHMLPDTTTNPRNLTWGKDYANGYCYWLNRDNGFGFFRHLNKDYLEGTTQLNLSPNKGLWSTVFFGMGDLRRGVDVDSDIIDLLPTPKVVFGFDISDSDKQEGKKSASDIEMLYLSEHSI